MKTLQMAPQTECGCTPKKPVPQSIKNQLSKGTYMVRGAVILLGWYLLYSQLLPFSHFFTYTILGIEQGSHLGEAVQFFVYDAPKVLLLLTLVVFGIGILRTFVTPERTRKIIAGKREATGNVLAALFGVVTPFCSCSATPLFLGFVQAGIPLGVTLSYLIAAPLVNEIALVLLYGLLGWKIAALYMVTGVSIAIVAGWIIGRMGMEDQIKDWIQEMRSGEALVLAQKLTWGDRIVIGQEQPEINRFLIA